MAKRKGTGASDATNATAEVKRTLRKLSAADRKATRAARRASAAPANFVLDMAKIVAALTAPIKARPQVRVTLPSTVRRAGARARSKEEPGLARFRVDASDSRPTNDRGETSIHFRQKHLSKGNNPGSAVGHQQYLEREQARDYLTVAQQTADPAEARNAGSDHQDYVEREGAIDRLSPVAAFWQPDAQMPKEMLEGVAVFGTIGETIEERRAFWHAVEKIEREPGPGTLAIYVGSERWREITEAPDFPDCLKEAKISAWSKRRRDPSDAGEVGDDDQPPAAGLDIWRVPMTTPNIEPAIQWLKSKAGLRPGIDLKHEPGRGGRIQFRIEAELPHELTSEQRLNLVWEWAEIFRRRKLPHFAALHRPDAIKNDLRNWHVHFDYYDRPAQKFTEGPHAGLWDFEVAVQKSDRHWTTLAQKKDREVNERGWVKKLRAEFVEVTNRHLAMAGIAKRHTALSYRDAKINAIAGEHLGPGNHALAAKGVLTPTVAKAGLREQTNAFIQIDQRYEKRMANAVKALKSIGMDPKFVPPQEFLTSRIDAFLKAVRRHADVERKLSMQNVLLRAEIGAPAGKHRALGELIARMEKTLETSPSSIRNMPGFRRKLSSTRIQFEQLDTQITKTREKYDEKFGPLMIEKAAAVDALEQARILFRQLGKLRRKSRPPTLTPAQRHHHQQVAIASIARVKAREGRNETPTAKTSSKNTPRHIKPPTA